MPEGVISTVAPPVGSSHDEVAAPAELFVAMQAEVEPAFSIKKARIRGIMKNALNDFSFRTLLFVPFLGNKTSKHKTNKLLSPKQTQIEFPITKER